MTIPSDLEAVIAAIHAAPHRLVYEFAGAGSQALFWLHAISGSSRTIIEASDRYAPAALAALLGAAPVHSVAPETAAAMARTALRRAAILAPGSPLLLGVACTAAITTNRERRGANRACIACASNEQIVYTTVTLAKGRRGRVEEEVLVSRLVLRAIAQACNVMLPVKLDLSSDEHLEEEAFWS